MSKDPPALSDFLHAKASERRRTQPPGRSGINDELQQLICLFPDIDRDYARMCLENYRHDRVASVTEKLLDSNFSNYPRQVPDDFLTANP